MNQGFSVTLIGMGVVFVLLTALVGIVHVMSAICLRFPERLPEAVPAPDAPEAYAVESELISVVGAAIHAYRRRAGR
jgi:sodium pump decarboxylase gamma subunit